MTKNLTIIGPQTSGTPQAIIDAQNKGRIFNIISGASVTLQYLLIQNGTAPNNTNTTYGGGIYNNGNLKVKNCTIQNNIAPIVFVSISNSYYNMYVGYGDGIYNNATMDIIGSSINNNRGNSGGIYNNGKMNINNSKIYKNNGTGITNKASLNMASSSIYDNTGNGIDNSGNTTINEVNITSNSGRGIDNSGNINIDDSNISKNEAHNGGGIENNGNVTITNSNINNNAATWGGGIDNNGNVTITNSNINDNTAEGGGGILNYYDGKIAITGSNIYNNVVRFGGGIENNGEMTVDRCNIFNNAANTDNGGSMWGGGISNEYGATMAITNSNIYENTAANDSGGIANWDSSLSLEYCRIYGNTAPIGSAIYNGDEKYVKATYNWWGSDNNPSNEIYGNVNYTPWLVYNPELVIKSIDPANTTNNVPSNKVIEVTFSEPVQIGNGWIELKNSNGTVMPITESINGYILTINHTTLTSGNYTLTFQTGSITNLAGTKLALYSTAFTVDSIQPTASALPVGGVYNASKNVTLNMSEPGSIYYTIDGTTPTTSSTKYTGPIIISSTKTLKFLAVDLAGNQSPIYTQKYTIDKTAPKVSTSTPTNGKTGVKRNQTITITFNENIKSGTNYSKITLKSSAGKTIPITKSISGKILTIKHSSKLAAKTKYILTLYSGCVKDVARNPVAAKTITFTTGSA